MTIYKDRQSKITLFDLDGTAVELWEIHKKVYRELIHEQWEIDNVNFLEEGYVPGKAPEDIVRTVLKNRGCDSSSIEPKIRFIKPALARLYPPAVKEGEVNVLPGVFDLLKRLGEMHVLRGVLTGNHYDLTEILLEKTGLNEYFDFSTTASDSIDRVERMKLAIRKGEEILGRKVNLGNVYFLDDGLEGISISKQVGIKHVSVATGYKIGYEKLLVAKPYHVLEDLSDMQEVLRILELE